MSRLAVDYAEVESHVKHQEGKEFMNLAKFYKGKGCYQEFLDMHYNSGKSTLFHLMARYCTLDILQQFFDYTESIMGKNYLTYELNTKLDRNGRTFVIIAAKHLEEEVIAYLLKEYALDPGFYAAYNHSSAMTYLIKRKLGDCLVKALHMIDQSKISDEGMKWFQEDMSRMKDTMTEQELVKEKWIRAMTYKHEVTGRISKMILPTESELTSFGGQNRLRQLMRHLSSQLFFRWKFQIGISELTDVQLMYMIKTVDKDNPHPKPVLFVACTPLEVGDYVKDDFKTRSIKEILLKEYPGHEDEEAEKRSKRFSKKLQARVYGMRVIKQSKASREIVNLLLCDKKRVQKVVKLKRKIKMPYLDLTENSFYLAVPGGNYDACIHAEEALCDISKHLELAWEHKTVIYGKNRSCLTCCGRMKACSVDEFNKHQGMLFVNNLAYQDEDALEETLDLLYEQPSYITISKEEIQLEEDEKAEYVKETPQEPSQERLQGAIEENAPKPEQKKKKTKTIVKYLKSYDTASDTE